MADPSYTSDLILRSLFDPSKNWWSFEHSCSSFESPCSKDDLSRSKDIFRWFWHKDRKYDRCQKSWCGRWPTFANFEAWKFEIWILFDPSKSGQSFDGQPTSFETWSCQEHHEHGGLFICRSDENTCTRCFDEENLSILEKNIKPNTRFSTDLDIRVQIWVFLIFTFLHLEQKPTKITDLEHMWLSKRLVLLNRAPWLWYQL